MRKDPICLVRSVLHRDVDGLDVSTADRAQLLRPEFLQDDGVERGAIIAKLKALAEGAAIVRRELAGD